MKLFSNSAIIFVIVLLAVGGCDTNSSDPAENQIIGQWAKSYDGDTIVLSFLEDGTFLGSNDDGSENFTTGTYTISNSDISILDEECGDDEGRYTFSVNGNVLTFTLIIDACERSEVIPGTWTRR